MFERYTLISDAKSLQNNLGVDIPDVYSPQYNAAPTKLLPIITSESPKGLSFFYWGVPPSMGKNKTVSKRLINAEKNLLETKFAYKNSLHRQRCIIPADGLYYWKKVSKKGKVPYRFTTSDSNILFMAGIWDEYEDTEGTTVHTFNIITGSQNPEPDLFEETFPAFIGSNQLEKWLSKTTAPDEIITILNEPHKFEFVFYPVSSHVNNIELNSSGLIQKSIPADQFGNYSLFD